MFGFSDWDKCKTARKDLVRAFLHSHCPPLDLVRIALATPDADRFLKRLLKEQGGLEHFHCRPIRVLRAMREARTVIRSLHA